MHWTRERDCSDAPPSGKRVDSLAEASLRMKMKQYASFEQFSGDQTPKARAVLRALRSFVAKAAPGLVESVKWGNGCWLRDAVPICYAHVEPDHVQFGFFYGASLDDPQALLHGAGKYVRHIKLRKPTDLQATALRALLKQALAKTPA
jgi:hypothetical protein